MMRSTSITVFACHSAACRPPKSGGTGGSLPAGAAGSGPRMPISSRKMVEVMKATALGEVYADLYWEDMDKRLVQDTMVALRAAGMDRTKPRTVSAAEFERLAAESPDDVVARSAPPQNHRDLLESDTIRLIPASVAYGKGIYFAGGRDAARHVLENYQVRNNTVLRAIVDRSSLADYDFIMDVISAAKMMAEGGQSEKPKKVLDAANVLVDVFKESGVKLDTSVWGPGSSAMSQPSLVAPLLGYKGYVVKNPNAAVMSGDAVDYVVILDRSALTVPDTLPE